MNITEIYKKFPTNKDCILHLETIRWNNKPACPYCNSSRVTTLSSELRHHCNACNTTISITVNTIFHHTHLDLQKWFLAIALILHTNKNISIRQLARDLQVTKDTACKMQKRIRNVIVEQEEFFYKILMFN